jgi:hypothetical protein
MIKSSIFAAPKAEGMEKMKYTWQQCFAYLYAAFAQISDGNLPSEEMKNIKQKVKRWGGDQQEFDRFCFVLQEAIQWFGQNSEKEELVAELEIIAIALMQEKWFTINCRNLVVSDLINIAMADHCFHEREKGWIIRIGNLWGIEAEW